MNISGKCLRVWKKQEQNGFIKLDLGDSRKLKDGTYDNFTWFGCTLVGKAKDAQIDEGDKVEVKSGLISKRKYNDKYYDDIVIFEIDVMEKGQAPTTASEVSEFVEADTDDSLPF